MYTYTIAGTTYIASNDRLYTKADETHSYHEADADRVYLYDGDLVKIDVSHGTAKIFEPGMPDFASYEREEEFGEATPLQSVTPDEIEECPECSGWLGQKDADEDDKFCIQCGHGMDTD